MTPDPTLSRERRAEIEERLAKATPGPWLTPAEAGDPYEVKVLDHEGCDVWPWANEADMVLAYAAPSDLRYLLDALRESREELGEAVRLLDDIDGAMSLGSVRRGVALMQDVAQADWVFGTLKKIRAYLAARHPEPVEEEPNG